MTFAIVEKNWANFTQPKGWTGLPRRSLGSKRCLSPGLQYDQLENPGLLLLPEPFQEMSCLQSQAEGQCGSQPRQEGPGRAGRAQLATLFTTKPRAIGPHPEKGPAAQTRSSNCAPGLWGELEEAPQWRIPAAVF